MGREHAAILGEMQDVEVAAVFSRSRERAVSAAALCNARAFTDVEALLHEAEIDAVDVCLPSSAHRGRSSPRSIAENTFLRNATCAGLRRGAGHACRFTTQ
jgi:hypothetical protein